MTNPPYDDGEVEATAARMLNRYTSGAVAAEMAYWHAMDHHEGSPHRTHWLAVYGAIQATRLGRRAR